MMAEKKEKGGFFVGVIVGCCLAWPSPSGSRSTSPRPRAFHINKLPQRTAEQDASEAERNKNWD